MAQSGGTVNGRVTFGDDNSNLHHVSVQIVELRRSTFTDDNGAFSFAGVAPGRYTLLVHQEGFADQRQKVTVESGSVINVDFQLVLTGIREDVTVTATGS